MSASNSSEAGIDYDVAPSPTSTENESRPFRTIKPINQASSKILRPLTAFGSGLFGPTFQDGNMNPKAAKLLRKKPGRTAPSLSEQRIVSSIKTTQLPEAHQVFIDLLQQRDAKAASHPNGVSSLHYALAMIISLSLVRINDGGADHQEVSPILNLSPLYGRNDAESDLVREKDGRGMLSPDSFFEDRIMLLPPAVSALLILWSRNHNYIARRLLLNNEGKKWRDPATPSPELLAQDEEIFTIARVINCIQFKNVVSNDFLKALVGHSSLGDVSDLNELIVSERSEGNHNAGVEFSFLYNWSSLMASQDLEEIKIIVEANFDLSFDDISKEDFRSILDGSAANLRNSNRRSRHSAGLQRGKSGRFNDEDIARVLQDATELSAGAPGSRSISPLFQVIETMIVTRARQQRVCSLNDFRQYLGLEVLKSFEEWNSDPVIAGAARDLYSTIDNLELYPGLQAEQPMKGSGLSLGDTMTWGSLVHIANLIRTDSRFMTDCTAGKLTHWGYKECIDMSNIGAYGAVLPKILQRNLPRHYPFDNIYTLFPLTCPQTTSSLLDEIPDKRYYDLNRPQFRPVKILETKEAISYVFNNPSKYPTVYGKDLKALTDGYGFYLGIDDEILHDRDQMMTLLALIPDKDSLSQYADYFGKTAAKFISDRSTKNNGHRSIDVVRDVINATCTSWVCETLCGISLVEPREKAGGIEKSGKEDDKVTAMHDEFGALYAYVFKNTDPEAGWASRSMALETSRRLKEDIGKRLPISTPPADQTYIDFLWNTVNDTRTLFTRISQEMGKGVELSQRSAITFLDRIIKSGRRFPLEDPPNPEHSMHHVDTSEHHHSMANHNEQQRAIANILGLAVVTAVNYAQACAQTVDFYLDEKYTKEREEIIRLATLNTADAQKEGANLKIMGYIREAQRLGQPLGLWRDVAENDIIHQGHGHGSIGVKAGDRIFADFNAAHTNPADFPDPQKIDPNRKTPSIQGMGLHKCPGISFVDKTMPELIKAIFRLKNLRRDSGKAGRLERFVAHPLPLRTDPMMYLDASGDLSHFPRSLCLLYDGDASSKESPSKQKRRWRVLVGDKTKKLRAAADRTMSFLLILILASIILYMITFALSGILSFRHRPSKRTVRVIPKEHEVKFEHVKCPKPRTVFQPWDINTILPGPDGTPLPLEYTLDSPKAHQLSVVDIDAKDMRMTIHVDTELRGYTLDFELDKTANCGDDEWTCIKGGFSSAVVVVPPGKHTVKIQWAGKEFVNGTEEMDWGKERGRRLKWKREYCA